MRQDETRDGHSWDRHSCSFWRSIAGEMVCLHKSIALFCNDGVYTVRERVGLSV